MIVSHLQCVCVCVCVYMSDLIHLGRGLKEQSGSKLFLQIVCVLHVCKYIVCVSLYVCEFTYGPSYLKHTPFSHTIAIAKWKVPLIDE